MWLRTLLFTGTIGQQVAGRFEEEESSDKLCVVLMHLQHASGTILEQRQTCSGPTSIPLLDSSSICPRLKLLCMQEKTFQIFDIDQTILPDL